jgi:integrase
MRDKALPSAMLFSFARVGAVVMMRVRDFDDEASDAWLVLSEMGGKSRRLPAHHLVRESQRACVAAAELEARSRELLFQSAPRVGAALSGKALGRSDVWAMVKRRCAAGGAVHHLQSLIPCHWHHNSPGERRADRGCRRARRACLNAHHAALHSQAAQGRACRSGASAVVVSVQRSPLLNPGA